MVKTRCVGSFTSDVPIALLPSELIAFDPVYYFVFLQKLAELMLRNALFDLRGEHPGKTSS